MGADEKQRKRRAHALQSNIAQNRKFALDYIGSLSVAIWSDFESIVLSEILCVVSEIHQDVDTIF